MSRLFVLLVLAACGDPTVTVTVTELDGSNGVAVAFQDGDGPWRAATGDGTYAFDIASGRYGVAVWCATSMSRRVVFDHLTTDELTDLQVSAGCPVAGVTLRGAVRNLTDNAEVSWSHAAVTASATGAYALRGPAGTHDLVATSYQLAGAGRVVDAVVILRDREVGGDQTIDVDLASDDALALDTHDVTVAGAADDDYATVQSLLHTANRTAAQLGTTSGDDLTFQAVPADALVGGDLQSTLLRVTGPAVAGQPQRVRSHAVHATAAADLSVELLAATDAPAVSAGPTFTWSRLDGAAAYQLSVVQIDASGAEIDYAGTWSSAYLGADVTLAVPDLSGVDGWDDRASFVDGRTMFWAAGAVSTSSVGQLIAGPRAGVSISSTGWFGSFDP